MTGERAPVLQTDRLKLRAFTPQDTGSLHEILSGEEVLRYFPPAPVPDPARVERMIAGMNRHWETRGYGLWAVVQRSDGALLGRCGLQWLQETGEIEVDFILGRPYWGKGYATEAALAALDFGFDTLGAGHIVGIVHVDNRASRRVLEKIGMHRVEQKAFFGMPCYRYLVRKIGAKPDST